MYQSPSGSSEVATIIELDGTHNVLYDGTGQARVSALLFVSSAVEFRRSFTTDLASHLKYVNDIV